MNENSNLTEIQERVQNVLKDHIVQVLQKNSLFTKIQLETLLLDFHARQTTLKKVKHEEMAGLRKVARGSFSRVLHQGRKNFIKAAYTLFLLNYLGFFEQDPFNVFKELKEEILDYASQYDTIISEQAQLSERKFKEKINILNKVEAKLVQKLKELAQPMFSFK